VIQLQLRKPKLQEWEEEEDNKAAVKMEVNKEVKAAKVDRVEVKVEAKAEVKAEVKAAKVDRVEVKMEFKMENAMDKVDRVANRVADRVATEIKEVMITVVDHLEERFEKVKLNHKWKQPGKQCLIDLS